MVKYILFIERLISDMDSFPCRSGLSRLLNAVFAYRPITFCCIFFVLLCNTMGSAWANPEGGNVAVGSATIQQTSPSRLDVLQQSDKAVIDWQGFNIDVGEHTNFQQPSSSAVALNRVQSHDPSYILGRLTANGQLFLVNPNGLFFGRDSQTDVAGLVATTVDISNQDFLNGRYVFNIASDNSNAAVVNLGQIHAVENGFVILAAPSVRNEGQIHARLGKVALAGTNTLTVDFEGDGLLSFDIGSEVTQQPFDENGEVVETLVSNAGQIIADGGVVEMTVQTAEALVANAINMDGVVQARSVEERNGTIILSGGPAGNVGVNGILDASGADAGQTAGTVKVLGEDVGLFDGTRINVSGDAGGGEALVGGNYKGEGPEPNAKHTYVASEATINADALNDGDGGKIIMWANESADIQGEFSARGGAIAGDGGLIETSAKGSLKITSSPNASAPNGKGGTWLIDPTNILIVQPGLGLGINTNVVGADQINDVLNNGTNVDLDTSTATGGSPGDVGTIIQMQDAVIQKTTGDEATLTLRAENDIYLNDDIISSANQLNVIVNADSDETGGGSIVMSAGAQIISNGGDIVLGGGFQPVLSPAVGSTSRLSGVELDNARLSSGAGDIVINGRGADDLDDAAFGILLSNGALIESTTGKIFLQGVGGAGVVNNSSGILMEDSHITTQDGPIRLDGEGRGAGDLAGTRPGRNHGIDLEGTAVIEATGIGIIELVGTHTGAGAAEFDGNMGILLGDFGSNSAPTITTNTGTISLTGESNGAGNRSFGISMQANSVIQSLGGANLTFSAAANAIPGTGIFTIESSYIATSGLTSFNAGNNDISMLSSASNDFGAVEINNARDVEFDDINDIELGSISLTGGLEINATGTVGMLANSDIITNGGLIYISSAAINFGSGSLNTSADPGGGGITLTATNGAITVGELSTSSDLGQAGSIRLSATGDITTGNLFASSAISGTGGFITLNSDGAIDTSAGELNTIAVEGVAGAILLNADGDITTGDIFASSINLQGSGTGNSGGSGGISLNSGGNIITGGLLSPTQADFGSAGSSAGITVAAHNGSITTNGLVWAFSNAATSGGAGDSGDGGTIFFSANNDIDITGSIVSSARSDAGNASNGGPVAIVSTDGNISITDAISSSSTGSVTSGNGGAVLLVAAGSTTTRDIETSSAGSGLGGDIDIIDSFAIDTSAGTLDSSSEIGDGGDINLTTQGGDIITGTLISKAFGSTGIGGGDITLAVEGGSGAIDTSAGTLDSSSDVDDGGDINLSTHGGDITTGTLTSVAFGNAGIAGDIMLTVVGGSGSIDTTAGVLDAHANSGGGLIGLTAPTRVALGSVNASGLGGIELRSDEIDLLGGNASVQGDFLSISSHTPTQTIWLGGADNTDLNVLELTVSDWNALTDDFASVVIGASTSAGKILIDAAGISLDVPLIVQSGRIEANGPITSTSSLYAVAPSISMQDVTTIGYQNYMGTTTFNSDFATGGGNFTVDGDLTLASDTSITTDGGNFSLGVDGNLATLNGPGALSLSTGSSGDIVFFGDVGTVDPLSSVIVASANNISINGSFVAGQTEFNYSGALTSSDPSLVVDSLHIDPEAASAKIYGTVAGKSGQDAASVISGPHNDPDFTINDFIIRGVSEDLPLPGDEGPEGQVIYVVDEPLTTDRSDEPTIVTTLRTLVQVSQEYNMSDFTIDATIKAGWPLIVDFELARSGTVHITISLEDEEPVVFSLPGTTERNTTIIPIPQRVGETPKLASINITATETDGSGLVPLQLFGIGAGPKSVGGSVAIDEIQFNPAYLRTVAQESSAYRFFSHSDFDTVMVDFCHVSPGTSGDQYHSVNHQLISEGVEANGWIGGEERRIWNGRDEHAQVSTGLHKLQIRAWDKVGQWLTVWSESFLEVR